MNLSGLSAVTALKKYLNYFAVMIFFNKLVDQIFL